MQRPPSIAYTAPAQWLHWLIAALIIAQYVLAELAEVAADNAQLPAQLLLLANHKSVGMTVLMLALLRLIWRLGHPPPPPPEHMPIWQQRLAKVVHWLIYALIVAIPVSGWLSSSAAAYSVSWFGLFQWPDLVAADSGLKEQLVELHHLLGEGLLILVIGHVLAALKHRLVDRDGVLQSMIGRGAVASSVVVLAGVSWFFGLTVTGSSPAAHAADAGATTATPKQSASLEQSAPANGDLPPLWQVDSGQSAITFIAEQAGARFEGRWQRWQADIRFAQDALPSSSANVVIEATSADTQDADRDSTLATDDWFAANRFPTIQFSASRFETIAPTQEQPYAHHALGELTVKDLVVPVSFYFDVTANNKQRILKGTAVLDRLALGLGAGEWSDPDSVGHAVTVQVTVVATVP